MWSFTLKFWMIFIAKTTAIRLVFGRMEVNTDSEEFYRNEEQVKAWLEQFNVDYVAKYHMYTQKTWDYVTNLTEYNSKQVSDAGLQFEEWNKVQEEIGSKLYKNINNFSDPEVIRKVTMIGGRVSAINKDPTESRERRELSNLMESIYAQGTVTKDNQTFSLEPDITHVFASSYDFNQLLWFWWAWRKESGEKMRKLFERRTELLNKAAVDSGYIDYGQYERLNDFNQDHQTIESAIKLYQEILPLYKQLHAYVRKRLKKLYPLGGILDDGTIPAHILGNVWGQEWGSLYKIMQPYSDVQKDNITGKMLANNYTARKMFEIAEEFFTSIGLDPMVENFWTHSVIEKPEDRPVQCHASAYDFFLQDDFRILMCAVVNQIDFQTIHHEIGHIQYFMEYKKLWSLYRDGANAAFHEAIGDVISLSVMTPEHLRTIGLLDPLEDAESSQEEYKKDINFLFEMALNRLAFVPYGLILDLWRWGVYDGSITSKNYNEKWWELRYKYQGLSPSLMRTEDDFDPGAKYHVAGNVPYMRYFFSFIGQFQIHKALCDAKNHTGPFHRCDIYQSKQAGQKLRSVLSLGASKPWPEVMEVITGQREFSAAPLLEYFEPLLDWLTEQNADEYVGWRKGLQGRYMIDPHAQIVQSPNFLSDQTVDAAQQITQSFAIVCFTVSTYVTLFLTDMFIT